MIYHYSATVQVSGFTKLLDGVIQEAAIVNEGDYTDLKKRILTKHSYDHYADAVLIINSLTLIAST